MIKKLGSEYLGLSGLFSSILQVLNLTELGFGSAAVFAMYKPIADDDYSTTGAILAFLRKVYKLIGLITITAGVVCTPFLKYLITGNVPSDINIYILYYIYIANTAVSYLLFAHKQSLLSALQLNRITSQYCNASVSDRGTGIDPELLSVYCLNAYIYHCIKYKLFCHS